jgi:hypothetical protein
MLCFLNRKLSDRKLRLLGVACARALGPLLADRATRGAVTTAERYADGAVSVSVLRRASSAAGGVANRDVGEPADAPRPWPPPELARLAGWGEEAFPPSYGLLLRMASHFVSIVANPYLSAPEVFPEHPYLPHRRFVSPLLVKDVVGNPFRRAAAAEPAWRTATVLALGCGIYEERAFDRLAILADALEDAGCTDRAFLDHCRGPGPHVRGCWAVDLLLGKR